MRSSALFGCQEKAIISGGSRILRQLYESFIIYLVNPDPTCELCVLLDIGSNPWIEKMWSSISDYKVTSQFLGLLHIYIIERRISIVVTKENCTYTNASNPTALIHRCYKTKCFLFHPPSR